MPKITCVKCKRKYIYDRKKGHRKTKCNTCNTDNKRKSRKKEFVKLLGGKCKKCNTRNIKLLTFHHRVPRYKKFNISESHHIAKSLVLKEVKKCDLLCWNCHMKLEYG